MRQAGVPVIGLVVLVLAAGCASAPIDPSASTSASAPSTAPGGHLLNATPVLANATTSTLHLWAPPELGLALANHTIATPKGATYAAQSFAWNTTFHARANLTDAMVDLWLRVTGSQAQAGHTDPGCTVAVSYTFMLNGTARSVDGGCGSAGFGVVPPGDHEIRFGAPPASFATPIAIWPKDGVTVTLTLYLESPNLGVTCFILEAPGADSSVTFAGLNETVPAPR